MNVTIVAAAHPAELVGVGPALPGSRPPGRHGEPDPWSPLVRFAPVPEPEAGRGAS